VEGLALYARIFLLTLVIAATPQVFDLTHAEDLGSQRRALELIIDTATKLCSDVSTTGAADSDELRGSVSANLNGLFSKLLGIGVSVSGATEKETYQNVLQADLPAALSNNAACKVKVLEILQAKLLGPVLSSPGSPPSQQVLTSQPGSRVPRASAASGAIPTTRITSRALRKMATGLNSEK
jgi:hypothetical protein